MAKHELLDERLTHSIIGVFFDVYNYLGFGFLENIYKNALERELKTRGHTVTHALQPIATRQLRNYLRATNLRVGLLLHFGPAANYCRCVSTRTRDEASATSESSIANPRS